MVCPLAYVNNGCFKNFQTKIIELIELHILCSITFYRRDDSFAEKDRQSLKIIASIVDNKNPHNFFPVNL